MAPGSKPKAPAWKDTAKCCCLECTKDPRGFKIQSRQTIGRHTRRDKVRASLNATSNTNSVTVLASTPAVAESLAATIADTGVSESTPSLEQPEPEDFNLDFADYDPAADNDDFPSAESDGINPLDSETDLIPDVPTDDFDNHPQPHQHPTPDSELQPAPPHIIELPTAHRETPAVRLAYLHAVFANIFEARPIVGAERQLNGELKIIALCGALPTHPRPARTIITAKRRLGLEIDDYIERRPICNVCYKFYSYDAIKNAISPNCTQPQCKGVFYREKRGFQDDIDNNRDADADQYIKRMPAKIQPYSSLVKAIQRFLQRPDFVGSLRDTSGDSRHPPISSSTMMTDLHDSRLWGALPIGLKRVVNEQGHVQDVDESPGSRKNLLDCEVGLSMTLNVDW